MVGGQKIRHGTTRIGVVQQRPGAQTDVAVVSLKNDTGDRVNGVSSCADMATNVEIAWRGTADSLIGAEFADQDVA